VRPVQPSDGTYPLFRFTNGSDYLLTAYLGENPEDYDFDGVAFRVYKNGGNGRRPLYRCRTSWDHFTSWSSNCEGQTKEGVLGYVSKTETEGSREIWRCNHETHYTTVNQQECIDKGKKVESSLGFSAP
jgi:hypothetical protein